jgi:hypothetical protein
MRLPLGNILTILTFLSMGFGVACASDKGAEELNDSQLAAIKGGLFCPFEICEDAPGTGICQPIPANTVAICALTKCSFSDEVLFNTELYSCAFAGRETCSLETVYRQCEWAFKLSFCGDKPNPLVCGTIVEPTCTLDIPERMCICGAVLTVIPCDWTSCSP